MTYAIEIEDRFIVIHKSPRKNVKNMVQLQIILKNNIALNR